MERADPPPRISQATGAPVDASPFLPSWPASAGFARRARAVVGFAYEALPIPRPCAWVSEKSFRGGIGPVLGFCAKRSKPRPQPRCRNCRPSSGCCPGLKPSQRTPRRRAGRFRRRPQRRDASSRLAIDRVALRHPTTVSQAQERNKWRKPEMGTGRSPHERHTQRPPAAGRQNFSSPAAG